jgi:PPIC-type PPIASE domain
MASALLPADGFVRRLLKEPLLHFTLAGALLFGGYASLNGGGQPSPPDEAIRIGEGEVRWLRETFASQWQRSPTAEEMKGLLATLIEEELLAREARALGLDRHDTVVRRRLAQKLGFVIEDTSRIADPTDGELRRFHKEHAERYKTDPRITFRHVFFSPQRRSAAAEDAAAALMLVSAAGTPVEGDPMLLDDRYDDVDLPAVTSLFGPDFAQAVFAALPGAWRGPVKSAYGLHLVQVTNLRSGSARLFEDVREVVANDWRRERERETKAAYLARLRDKYRVAADPAAERLLGKDGPAP